MVVEVQCCVDSELVMTYVTITTSGRTSAQKKVVIGIVVDAARSK